ncbi:MAG TPA: hypothetical protein VHD83_20400 [Puia sp.]|nr:hypothetical protein [Puia sp.]
MRRLSIIHFAPIEWYPPVMNWLNYLASEWPECEVRVYTLRSHKPEERFEPANGVIRVIRPVTVSYGGTVARSLSYFLFYLRALLGLITWRPGAVLYYETMSSLPALIYKRWFGKKARLLIHYHEYVSPREYQEGMKLTRWLHEKEAHFYRDADWLSQTNDQRAAFFRADHKEPGLPSISILPNYPPASWQRTGEEAGRADGVVKAVYVGALSLETMYVREMAEWVMGLGGRLTWDIYSGNSAAGAREYIEGLNSPWIRFHGGVDYYSLPAILKQYHVGLILYKGHIPNYIYNVPNKLYEYLVSGLDAWFPSVMTSSLGLLTEGAYPRVAALDFTRLKEVDLFSLSTREGLIFRAHRYSYEQALRPLLEKLKQMA